VKGRGCNVEGIGLGNQKTEDRFQKTKKGNQRRSTHNVIRAAKLGGYENRNPLP
jgi:hypothetical protein